MGRSKRQQVALAAIVLLLLIVGALLIGRSRPLQDPSALARPDSSLAVQANAVIDTLPVKGRAPMTGYERAEFGDGWVDTNSNGCSTREDVLRRDLTAKQLRDECVVEGGLLADPYSGDAITFQRGQDTSDEVQIDHVVALANAWQTGAQKLSYQERVAFANDLTELLAVDGDLNQQKGAGDAATWLPPNASFRCEYVSRQVLIKDTWGLWLTPAEKQAIVRQLAKC